MVSNIEYVVNNFIVYKNRFTLQQAVFTRIKHDDAMVAIVYKVTPSTGLPLILKIAERPQDYWRDIYFLKQFANSLPVPRIIQTISPETDIHGAILMEYLPGTLLKTTELTADLAYEIGSLLARIHLNRTEGYGDLTQPEALSPDSSVHFTHKFEEGFAECSNHLPRALLKQCNDYFTSHRTLFNTVDGPCIIHRDFRPGNMIVCEGKLQGIIDWASARASFAEDDFCPLEHGEWSIKSQLKQSILAGYASIRAVPDYQAIMPLLRMNRALATIGFLVKHKLWEGSQSRLYQANRRFLEAFLNDNPLEYK